MLSYLNIFIIVTLFQTFITIQADYLLKQVKLEDIKANDNLPDIFRNSNSPADAFDVSEELSKSEDIPQFEFNDPQYKVEGLSNYNHLDFDYDQYDFGSYKFELNNDIISDLVRTQNGNKAHLNYFYPILRDDDIIANDLFISIDNIIKDDEANLNTEYLEGLVNELKFENELDISEELLKSGDIQPYSFNDNEDEFEKLSSDRLLGTDYDNYDFGSYYFPFDDHFVTDIESEGDDVKANLHNFLPILPSNDISTDGSSKSRNTNDNGKSIINFDGEKIQNYDFNSWLENTLNYDQSGNPELTDFDDIKSVDFDSKEVPVNNNVFNIYTTLFIIDLDKIKELPNFTPKDNLDVNFDSSFVKNITTVSDHYVVLRYLGPILMVLGTVITLLVLFVIVIRRRNKYEKLTEEEKLITGSCRLIHQV